RVGVALHVPDPWHLRHFHPAWRPASWKGGLMTSITADAAGNVHSHRRSLRRNRRWGLVTSYFFLILFSIFFLPPPLYQLVTATKSSAEISRQTSNPWLPSLHPTLENIDTLWNHTDFPIYLKNSAIVTVVVVVITMLIAVPAAFSLGRMRFWGSGILATGVFLTYLVPDSLLFIPLFKIVGGLGLLNSYWALVLVYPTLAVPLCTWIMIRYFQSIPKELDEAALIDGANHLQMLFKIFIPVALPGLIAATIFAFTVCWAEFVYPMAFIYSSNQLVLTAGTITTLLKSDVYPWGLIITAALLAPPPPPLLHPLPFDSP